MKMKYSLQIIYLLSVNVCSSFQLKYNKVLYSKVLMASSKVEETIDIDGTPKWASGGLLSDFVNLLIKTKPIYSIMKEGARNTIISTAEKNGVEWTNIAKELDAKKDILEKNFIDISQANIDYPDYYVQEFHAYESGNLNWLAAYECESATLSMALRVYPKEKITPWEAQDRLRFSYLDTIKSYISEYSSKNKLETMVDIGCSVGISTFYLADYFKQAKTIYGLDLSPYFLAVAKLRQASNQWFTGDFKNAKIDRIKWLHEKAESTSFKNNQLDLVSVSFMFHELPQQPTKQIIDEFYRITKPGGVIALTDNNPRSSVIQNLPPVLFTLMKSTEPWSDEYYIFNMEEALKQSGFINVVTKSTDPRHRTIVAMKPVL